MTDQLKKFLFRITMFHTEDKVANRIFHMSNQEKFQFKIKTILVKQPKLTLTEFKKEILIKEDQMLVLICKITILSLEEIIPQEVTLPVFLERR
jgi:hypothetical protein